MATRAKVRKTSDEINFVDSLPEEVLCTVFDYLDLASVKNASLSCRRWHNVIFQTSYVGRFSFNFDLFSRAYSELPSSIPANDRLEAIKEMGIETLRHTQRCYRKLRCRMLTFTNPELTALFTSIPYSISTLNFAYFNPIVLVAIPLMPQLHSLTLGISERVLALPVTESLKRNGLPKSPCIRSRSVVYLELIGLHHVTVDMPKLKSFSGHFSVLCASVNRTKTLVPETLNHLIMKKQTNYFLKDEANVAIQIVRRLTHLETLELRMAVRPDVFLAICESCIALKVLEFEEFVFSNKNVLDHLWKLTNLRRFQCGKVNTATFSYRSGHFITLEVTKLKPKNLLLKCRSQLNAVTVDTNKT